MARRRIVFGYRMMRIASCQHAANQDEDAERGVGFLPTVGTGMTCWNMTELNLKKADEYIESIQQKHFNLL